ncbi:hypothetical protein HI914_02140 [Erysiphe necator]|nr:hypothetical protein HI914_02140 [Erysiphe necator]
MKEKRAAMETEYVSFQISFSGNINSAKHNDLGHSRAEIVLAIDIKIRAGQTPEPSSERFFLPPSSNA